LWWIDTFVAPLVSIGVPFAMFNCLYQSLEAVTEVWLLPVVCAVVSGATGGIVAQYLPPARARLTLVCSYIIWGWAFPIAVLAMAICFQRLSVCHLPPRATISSVFLPLGSCGQFSSASFGSTEVV
jgi:tellurite resistance protein TehA-like permease